MEDRFAVCAGRIFAFALVALFLLTTTSVAQPNVQGQWTTLPYAMPINPVHVALLHTGKVLVVSGSGNVAGNTNYQAAIWDPQANTISTQPVAWDMFCNGMVVLPDGRPFIMGGTLQYDPFHGELRTSFFDPATGTFTDAQNMAHGRWYPTATTLGDGRVMVFSGLNETGGTNTSVEIYTVGTGWGAASTASWTPPLYPRMHLLPNGKVFYSGAAIAHFRSLYEGLEQRCNHQLQRHTDVRHFRIAGANTNQQLRSPRLHHGRWQSLHSEHRGHR